MSLSLSRAFVTLAATEFEHLVAFYQALLGRSPQPLVPQRYAEFQLGGLSLAIFFPKPEHQSEFAPRNQATAQGPLSLCLEVTDLSAALQRLEQLNCPHSEVMTASHGCEVYAADPLGNRLIVYQPLLPDVV